MDKHGTMKAETLRHGNADSISSRIMEATLWTNNSSTSNLLEGKYVEGCSSNYRLYNIKKLMLSFGSFIKREKKKRNLK